MPTPEEILKLLREEKTYAHFVRATSRGFEYYAQIIYPGRKDLLAVEFLVPLDEMKGHTFGAVMPVTKLVKWLVVI